MDGLAIRMILKRKHEERKGWEFLCRILLLKLAGELRFAKRQVRFFERVMEQETLATRKEEFQRSLQEAQAVALEAHNVFQGAKALWADYAPEENT